MEIIAFTNTAQLCSWPLYGPGNRSKVNVPLVTATSRNSVKVSDFQTLVIGGYTIDGSLIPSTFVYDWSFPDSETVGPRRSREANLRCNG